jgi:HD-GYP domain-containing protein (c-di-GMP phosphodiesterase class II)
VGDSTLSYSNLDKPIKEAIDAVSTTNIPAFIMADGEKKAVILNRLMYEKMLAHSAGETDQGNVDDLEEAYVRLLLLVSASMDNHASYLAGHTERVAMLACAVADELGLEEGEINDIRMASLLHDIGELVIPIDIMHKVGKLTPEEIELVRQHPRVGAELVSPIKGYANIAELIYSHQERWDGSGYPSGLKGKDIPIGARIIAVASAYDALTNVRLHRETGNHSQAFQELQRCSGSHFDPEVVEAFLRIF